MSNNPYEDNITIDIGTVDAHPTIALRNDESTIKSPILYQIDATNAYSNMKINISTTISNVYISNKPIKKKEAKHIRH